MCRRFLAVESFARLWDAKALEGTQSALSTVSIFMMDAVLQPWQAIPQSFSCVPAVHISDLQASYHAGLPEAEPDDEPFARSFAMLGPSHLIRKWKTTHKHHIFCTLKLVPQSLAVTWTKKAASCTLIHLHL